MIVKGLNKDLYLINNPIWVEVSEVQDATTYIEVVLTNVTDPLNPITTKPVRLYPYNSAVEFNLGEMVKGNFPKPHHPENPIDDASLGTNVAKFTISVMEIVGTNGTTTTTVIRSSRGRYTGPSYTEQTISGDVSNFTKTFIRGGRKTMVSNQSLTTLDVLKESEKIPRWGGYPVRQYYIGIDKQIKSSSIIPTPLVEEMPILGCDPLYVRFLNSLGGYSFWLFESYAEKTKTQSAGVIKGRHYDHHAGVQTKYQLIGNTRVGQRHFDLMAALLKSPEIAVYNRYGQEWTGVTIDSSDFEVNNFETVRKVEAVFNIRMKENPSLSW